MRNIINESSLSRLYKHAQEHDCGLISASRSSIFDDDGKEIKLSRADNAKRTSQLISLLRDKYEITRIRGSYIENFGTDKAVEVGESSLFVVDADDTGDLEKDLRSLGKEFEQDSILFMPKASGEGKLWGTTTRPEPYVAYDEFKKLKGAVWGAGEEDIVKSRVNGRPFVFHENKAVTYLKTDRSFSARLGSLAYA